jgi:predicted AlkP superfamily phosphohydrolase/phosphomutase
MPERVFVLGLDAFAPQLCFEKFREEMPNLSGLCEKSVWGTLNSTVPPLSCTAWVSFARGKNPGHSGFHGFASRKGFAYNRFFVANSTIIEKDRVWDILGKQGKKCIVINVPVTYPPYDVNGIMVSGFLTPNEDREYCCPREAKDEINRIAGGYVIDVRGFKKKPKETVFKELVGMEEKRFRVAKEFIKTKEWDFFIFVTTGTDRVHHAFWADMDEKHPDHKKGTPFKEAIKKYYRFIDEKIGEIAGLLGKNDALLIMSDHGARGMHGFVNVNEWLIREGYLKMLHYPKEPTLFDEAKIDWGNTKAFCTGNYVGRIFINLRGREPMGTVDKSEYHSLREEIREKLLLLRGESGRKMSNRVFRREEIYSGKHLEMHPDLIVYFDDLRFGANQMIGLKGLFSHNADKGRNAANHYSKGMFLLHSASLKPKRMPEINLIDLMPTVLRLLGVKIPGDVEGKPIV